MVFILLVFFLLASSFQTWRAIAVTAAPSGGQSTAGQKGVLLVQVRADGIRLGSQAMTLETLTVHIAKHLAQRPGQKVLVEPAVGVPLQVAIDVLDRLASAGVLNLSLTGPPGR